MKTTDDKFLSRISISLFILGLLAPLIIALFSTEIAVKFGVICEILALVFGLLSFRQKLGKITTIGVSTLTLMLAIAFSIKFINASYARGEVEREMIEADFIIGRRYLSEAKLIEVEKCRAKEPSRSESLQEKASLASAPATTPPVATRRKGRRPSRSTSTKSSIIS